jgi:hypothetical protein
MGRLRGWGVAWLLAVAEPVSGQTTWLGGTNGNWTDPARWSAGVPTQATNAQIAAAGTYTVSVTGSQAANDLLLNAAGATVDATGAGAFRLGGTLTLAAGDFRMGGLAGSPQGFTGGTVGRGAGGTGTFTAAGVVRFTGTQVDATAIRFPTTGAQVRLAGGANFTPGGTLGFVTTQTNASVNGVIAEADTTLAGLTVTLGPNITLGAVGGTTLTVGPTTLVQLTDPSFNGPSAVGRLFEEGTAGLVTLDNRGTIRANSGELYLGRYFDVADGPSNVAVTNAGRIEAVGGAITAHANTLVNQTDGVVRATAGGGVFLFGRTSLRNLGTIEVGEGSSLDLGGRFATADLGTVTRTGTNTVGLLAARMDNTGTAWPLSAATGRVQLKGDFVSGSRIVGGAITAADGAKLEVRPISGFGDVLDFSTLEDVQVGAGVLEFSRGGRLRLQGSTSLAAGESITLPGDSTLAFDQTRTVDNLTVTLDALANRTSVLAVIDSQQITLGPGVVVRKLGAGDGAFQRLELTAGPHVGGFDLRGQVRVEAGRLTLGVGGAGAPTFTNRGLIRVDAGATFAGTFPTRDGGRLAGGGTVSGSPTVGPAGTVAPTGTLTVSGNLTLVAAAGQSPAVAVTATRTGANVATADRVAVGGWLDLTGNALRLDLTGPSLAVGESYSLVLATAAGGVRRNGTAVGAGFAFPGGEVSVVSADFPGFSNVSLTTTAADTLVVSFVPVPEPVGLVVLAMGVLAGYARGRRLGPTASTLTRPAASPTS